MHPTRFMTPATGEGSWCGKTLALPARRTPSFLPEFLENVKTEVHAQVQRLCHHPSLAVWCGNNEIEDMHMAWVHMQKYVQWTEKFFYEILEPEIRAEDPDTPYTPGSRWALP